MASIAGPFSTGPMTSHVLPASRERSKWTRQPSVPSVLDGDSHAPSLRTTGLFLIGPRTPSGRRRASLQVRPPSAELFTMPHHLLGDGPTL
jgi:hypothetical protein